MDKNTVQKLQATLTKIKCKKQCFFNVAQYVNLGLIKEHGKTTDNRTNWILTDKANAILNVQI